MTENPAQMGKDRTSRLGEYVETPDYQVSPGSGRLIKVCVEDSRYARINAGFVRGFLRPVSPGRGKMPGHKLCVLPLDRTLRSSDNSLELLNRVILKTPCEECNPVHPLQAGISPIAQYRNGS